MCTVEIQCQSAQGVLCHWKCPHGEPSALCHSCHVMAKASITITLKKCLALILVLFHNKVCGGGNVIFLNSHLLIQEIFCVTKQWLIADLILSKMGCLLHKFPGPVYSLSHQIGLLQFYSNSVKAANFDIKLTWVEVWLVAQPTMPYKRLWFMTEKLLCFVCAVPTLRFNPRGVS